MAAQQSKSSGGSTISPSSSTQQLQHKEVNAAAMFHDFLGMKPAANSNSNNSVRNNDSSSPAAVLATAKTSSASAAGGGGGRGPLSTASDLASERQAASHLEGIPYYVPRSSDVSGHEMSNRLAGSNKRSNSDSAFTAPIGHHDSVESLHLMKMLKNAGPGERPRRSLDDESFFGMQSTRPSSAASLILQQPSSGSRLDPTVSKWERSAVQYPLRGSHYVPFTQSRFGDAGPSGISQAAADEGSRTGIKGPGLLSCINNTGSANLDKSSIGVQPSGSSKPRPGIHILEPESSAPSSRQGLASASRQMTIFYGGQAHVFDDVHPNKADVIMALAGSNGGSWSTAYSPKPSSGSRPAGGETSTASAEYEAARSNVTLLQHELRRRLPVATNSMVVPGVHSSDRITPSTGGHHGGGMSITVGGKEARNQMQKAGDHGNTGEETREV
ncbi:Protein TIFY 8 [Linum grandiflorum]